MNFIGKLISMLMMGMVIAFYQPITVQAEEDTTETEETTTEENAGITEATESTEAVEEASEISDEVTIIIEEGAIMLGEFRLTYYCCEKHRHICGDGTGVTKSGRPVEAGRSIAVDPNIIPLGSRVWIDFGDGEGWHEYSADDTGALVEGNRIDIAIETHHEALHQSKLRGQVCFSPPPNETTPQDSGEFSLVDS